MKIHGYCLETHKVKTEDEYILQILRVVEGSVASCSSSENEPKIQSTAETNTSTPKPAVLIVHGFLSCGRVWLLNTPDKVLRKFTIVHLR